MTVKSFLKKEKRVWHERFVPSFITAIAVASIALFLKFRGSNIVLVTSLAASLIILTHKFRHKLTILGTVFYSYFLAAVVGFIFLVFNGLNLIRELNQEVAAALEQPTLTPTPLIVAVVLPSGHTPPNAAGGTRPNDAEIPEHLKPLVQSLADIPVPTPGPKQAVRIQIPAIGIDAPVVQGDGWEQ